MRDPYAVLGVDPSATHDEIRAVYRARSMLLHPDLHEGRPEQVRMEAQRAMTQLTDAYEAITRKEPRAGAAMAGGASAEEQVARWSRRLGRLASRSSVMRDAAEAADRGGSLAFRLGWVLGRRRAR